MKSEALTIIEADPEPPLLPLDLLPSGAERRAFGLNDLVWLRRCPRARSQIRMILAVGCGMRSSAIERTLFVMDTLVCGGREAIDLCDLQLLRDFCTDVKRVGIVICVGIFEQP